MTFWQEFALVFTGMNWYVGLCLFIGLACVIIEIYNPGFGFFGISGAILIIVGIVLRMVTKGEGNPIIQLLILLVMCIIILAIAFGFLMLSFKKGWLSRTAFVDNSKALPEEHTKGTQDYRFLVGQKGECITDLRPSGSVVIDTKRFDVVTLGNYIEKGKIVTVVSVEGGKIIVE